jgi:hypothetical protein
MEFRVSRAVFALAGVLPALALLVYERGFMTTDLSADGQARWRVGLALFARCSIIGAGAYITAQPVELIAFNDRIDRRIHEERMREVVLARAPELIRWLAVRDQVKGGESGAARKAKDAEDVKARIERLRGDLRQATQRRAQADAALIEARRIRSDAYVARNRAAANLKNAGEPPPPALQRALDTAEARAGNANSAYRARQDDAAAATGSVQALTEELSRLTNDLRPINEAADDAQESVRAEDRVKALKNWVMTVRNLKPGTPYLDPFTNQQIQLQDYDFLDKLRIITDLRNGAAPRWPNAPENEVALARKEYGILDPHPDAMRADAWNAWTTYWGFFLLAILVPFMSLVYKLLMPAHLSLYYSQAWQAGQGNGWSIGGQSWLDRSDDRATKDDRE